MSTKPPAKVQESPASSNEKIAYLSVSGIPTEEPNDQNRLGYHVWRWLSAREGTLEQLIVESGARIKISKADAAKLIAESLAKQNITL
jgi:hypothetical protein